MNHIITYFYLEQDDNINSYGISSKIKKKNEYYFRCILNFFCSSLKYNKNSKHYFICNETENIEFIENFNFKKFLADNSIELINLKSKYVQKNIKWAGSMYLFDAIEYFKTTDNKDDNYIFFDNDVLIHSNLNDIDSLNQKFDYMVYDITHECKKDNNWIVNFNDISESYILDNKFKPIGGEFIAIKGDFISKFIDSFKSIKTINGLYTEEHYLSYLSSYVLKNYNIAFINNDDGVIKRIWTTFKYNNRSEKDIELKILHLPSEKLYGLYWLSKYCIKNIRTNKEYSNEVALIYTGVIYKLNIKIRKVIARILYRYIY